MKEILKNITAIKKIFGKEKVVLAFVFGSTVKKTFNKLSDLDLAVVLDKSIQPSRYEEIRLSLLDQLSRLLKGKPLDMAILNNSSPLLTQMVISRGKIIFCRSEDFRVNFQSQVLQRFDDTLYLRRIYYQYLQNRVEENKLGEKYGE